MARAARRGYPGSQASLSQCLADVDRGHHDLATVEQEQAVACSCPTLLRAGGRGSWGPGAPAVRLHHTRTLGQGRASEQRRTRPATGLTPEIPIGELTLGNAYAADWLQKWAKYCHDIDDQIDERRGAEAFLAILASAIELYTHPFFLAHWSHLRPIVISITNAYADSVAWEKSEDFSERQMADTLRFCGVEMYCMVAAICGGYEHMRKFFPILRKQTWTDNHDAAGNPC